MIFNLSNNGLDANNIVASNGLKGIEHRVKNLNGTVSFSSNQPSGFKTDITIPIGVKIND